MGRIKRNKVAKALFLMQKALLVHRSMGTDDSKNQTESLLKVTGTLNHFTLSLKLTLLFFKTDCDIH